MNNFTLDTFNPFQNTNPLGGDMERYHYNRLRAQHLSATFLYDLDPESKDLVDSQTDVRVYARPAMQAPDNLYIIGRELALVADTQYANMPMDLVNRAIDGLEDDGRKAAYREQLAGIGIDGQDTADSYYGLYAQIHRDSVRGAYNEQVARMEERREALTGLFGDIVAEAQPFSVSNENWRAFHDGVGRGVYTDEDEAALNKAVDAWSMMMGMAREYTDASANVLADATSGGLIMDRLRGDELAEALFFNQLQRYVQDQRTAEAERNFFVRFAHAFEAADKTLMTGIFGGGFKAFVTDEQVADYNREWERLRQVTGRENPNVPLLAEGDNWAERNLGMPNARLGDVLRAARASGQLNEDGSLRTMTDEERRSTQELNAFRGKLFNAAQGMYDIDGVAATFGKMLPSSALYLVPGGVFASAASMYTQDLAAQLGDGQTWTRASSTAMANAAIQAGVEKIAFGSLKPGRMVPGMNWLMSRPLMARALGRVYGTTAGRIGMGAVVGAAEETFVEPLAGLILSGAYNAVASDATDLDDPVAEYQKEMAEMLSPDQLLATSLYGLLLGGVSYSGQRAAAAEYRDLREQLVKIGVDEGRAAQVARMENPQERMVAAQALIQERLKADAGSVLSYVAELYPQMQGLATFENYFDKGQLPRLIPAGDGQVRVQEREADGTVTETVVAESTGRALVEARLEQLSGKEQMEFADMVLANAMVGSLSKDGERWVVSPEGQKMNHEYFQRLARAAGLRLSEGARPEEVDPEVHPHIPLGQLAQQGKAWEARMKVARHDYEQAKGEPVSDEEWARVSKRFESRVNRTGVRGADKRLRTVLRVARGKFGAMEVLEDVTEDNLVRDMEANGRTLDYYISNLRELEGALGKPGAFLRELKDGESESDRRMAVIEAMGKLVQSKMLADTASKGNGLSAALNAFLEMIRSWVLQAKAMFKMGHLVNQVLTDKESAEKLDKEFREDVDRLVAQDVEFLQSLQLADGLEAMQRVEAAHKTAAADRRVKRRLRAHTPVLDAAEEKHGEQVRKEQAEKEKTQAEVQADVEAAEAAVDGDFTSSVVNEEELDAIKAAAEKDGTFMKAPNGKPTNLTERQWLQVRTKAFKEWFGDWESAAYMQYFRNRLLGLLAPDVVQKFAGKEYEEIKKSDLDKRVLPMAYIPLNIAKLMGEYVTDNLIYTSDFRFVEHVLNHHPEIKDYERYVDDLLNAFSNPEKIYLDTKTNSFLFLKNEQTYFLSIANPPGEGQRYIQWKTAYHSHKLQGSRYKEIWNKNNREPVGADLHDKGPTRNEFPSARLSDLGSKRSIKEVVRDVKPENVSKVVDENGEPLVVTHATNAEPFTVFRRGERAGLSGKGIYFSPDGVGIWGKNIMRCFLNVRNPLTKENAPREVNNGGMSAVIPDIFERFPQFDGVMLRRDEITVRDPEQIKSATDNRGTFDGGSDDITLSVNEPLEGDVSFSVRTKAEPKKKGIGYKVFYQKDGKLYPPMVANPGGEDTPVGVWLDADEGVRAGESKTGRPQVKAGGKGTQGGSGTLAYRPGWHLGKIPYALQFNRKNPVTGEKDLFPKDFVWAEVEYAADVDYQEEAMSYGVNKNGKFQHSLAGLPKLPTDGYYEYRTNPNPKTDPWIITGAMKVTKVLTRAEVDELVRAAGREPQKVEGDASFSVVGEHAANWDEIKNRAFAGRDDGKLRVELDSSRAKLKSEALRGKNLKAYRQIIADWNELPEAERKEVEAYAELCAERDEAANKLNETTDNDFQEAYAAANKLADEVNGKRVKVREIIGEFFKMKGADGSVGITAKNEIIDAMAVDFWCEWGSDKVENALASDPMATGMALMDVLDYPELYEAYPQLENLSVFTEDLKGYYGLAGHNSWSDYIMMNRALLDNGEQFLSTLLHEVQHVIQRIEGFAKGGNKESVRRKVKELLEGTGARIDMLERDLRWFSAVDIARDLLKEARMLRRYPNAWKRSGRRFEFARMSDSAEEIRENILRDIAERYKEFRREDTSETLLLDMPDLLLPEVHFHSVDSIEAGLAALDKLKSRKLVFRGTAAKKNRRLKELQKRHDAMQKVLSEFEYEPYELYVRLAGEIESRNVQTRMGWTAEEREAKPFNETLEYPGEALVTYSMERVTAEWENTLDGYLQNPAKPGTPEHTRDLVVCPTPAVMQMVGAKGWDMVVTPGVLDKVMRGKHAVSVEALRQLPAALAAPVCIAVSDTPGCLEVITELKEGEHNVLVAVQLNSEHASLYKVKVNRIASMYGKERIASLLNHPMLYWDKAKARPWVNNYRLQLPAPIQPRRASGRRIQTPADLVKYKMERGLTFSMERASLRALEVLRGRSDERAGETLIKDWQRACEAWGQLAGTGEGYLGKGAKTLGEMQALIGATKGVLPEKYCRMGHLNGLMRWAGIYARMQQNGELPRAGVINGPIYQKFVERLQKGDELNRVQGMSEEEAKEALASLAGERLEVAMLKVANECRRRLELFLKDREKERIDWIVEKAYPNRQAGKAWPRGKMAAEAYRRMERAYEFMRMQPDDLAEFIKGIKHQLNELEPSDEEYEAKEAKLEDELFLAQTFGAWDNMSFVQARRASGAMAEMVLAGRNEWQSKLREERRRAEFVRRQIASHFKTSTKDMIGKRTGDAAKEKADKLTLGQSIARGGMSYSQLMLALEGKLGKEFTSRHIRMIAKAHQEIQRFNQERQRWMFKTLAKITGLKTEGEIEEWINGNNEIIDTGIVLTPTNVTQCVLTPDEAEMWLAMTAEEREERRRQLQEEARSKGQEPDNIPDEAQMEELRKKLEASEKNGTTPREYVLRREHRIKQPLRCTKEALLYAILTFEQDDYKRLMDVNGISEEQLARMRELVGPKLLAWGYAMREKLNEHGQHMAELYEAYTGVPFASRQNYFRGVFDTAIAKDNGEAIDVQNAITGGKYGVLVPRQYHNLKINWNTSATQVGLSTLNQQQNYISTAHITREWRTLLANPVFEKRMRAEIGDAAANMIQSWTKLIDGAVITDAKTQSAFKNFLGKILGFYAISRLAGNVYTIVKQASALLNGLVGGRVPTSIIEGNAIKQQLVYRHIGMGEYLKYLGAAMAGSTEISWQEVEQADYIAGRMSVEGHNLEQAAMLAPGQKVPSKLGRAGRTVSEKSMDAIGWADRKSNTVAALAIAEAVYQQAKAENKDGMVPDAELRRVAIETAGLMIELAAQPQLRTQKNYWAASGDLGVLGDFFFMFKSEALGKMGVYIAQMFNGNHKAWLAGWLSFGVANALLLALIDYMRGYGPDDDDDDFWTRQLGSILLNTLFQDVSSLPVLGDVPAYLKSQILGEREWKSSLVDMVLPIRDIWSAGQREVKNIQRGRELEAHVTALCSLARAVGAGGGWVANSSRVPIGTCAELALAAAAISNVVRFGKDVVKFLTED